MKQKTLEMIFSALTLEMMFFIIAYVLYYLFFARDVTNFNILVLFSGGYFMFFLLPLHMTLLHYCEKEEDKI